MLEGLFGTVNREKVLLFVLAREECYPREVAKFYDLGLRTIQNQLEKLELGNVLYSRMAGKTRLYAFNPRYPFLDELKSLLEKALAFYPAEQRQRLCGGRRRPRRKGKPL